MGRDKSEKDLCWMKIESFQRFNHAVGDKKMPFSFFLSIIQVCEIQSGREAVGKKMHSNYLGFRFHGDFFAGPSSPAPLL